MLIHTEDTKYPRRISKTVFTQQVRKVLQGGCQYPEILQE